MKAVTGGGPSPLTASNVSARHRYPVRGVRIWRSVLMCFHALLLHTTNFVRPSASAGSSKSTTGRVPAQQYSDYKSKTADQYSYYYNSISSGQGQQLGGAGYYDKQPNTIGARVGKIGTYSAFPHPRAHLPAKIQRTGTFIIKKRPGMDALTNSGQPWTLPETTSSVHQAPAAAQIESPDFSRLPSNAGSAVLLGRGSLLQAERR
uniref:Uncharacterized protein n=1 Tax=Oryza sativa subsp. japonica TaxID=39947 RepID=Q6ZDK6_ORYSJ|nr:hypothetical protein [Oryza sativa Japonica Group]